ncbi:MAG: hypothetical protein ACJAUP_000274 [Cellvibrionaceae bacterium]
MSRTKSVVIQRDATRGDHNRGLNCLFDESNKTLFSGYYFLVDDQLCGLRLLSVSNKRAFLRSRDTIVNSYENIISLCYRKFTAWRATAKKVKYFRAKDS